MVIKIVNYTKVLTKKCVLDDVNLELHDGRVYGFFGKNGSGKTMLMRAICGLILPTSGYVDVDGKVIGKDISFPKSIGVLIENPGFIPSMSGLHNLKYLAGLRGEITEEQIRKWMKVVRLDPDEKISFRKYSLGMKQKLGIAAAMMEEPDILILDEPFNALDEETAESVREMILSYRREGRIIILSCHDREEMENICDEIIRIKDGKVKEPE